ncbi:MAG: CYTH and CHAD domain-containing protein [Alphaproteobacteria bacterium]|nr:CYTH and CHAD domain-containing protein [Alphaproteobacteria bacterium]
MGHETELKFVGSEDALARLRRSPALRRLARKKRPRTYALSATYFDTSDFALRDAGFGLRVRREGGQFIQTVKSAGGPDVATRTELKTIVAELAPNVQAIDDKAVRRALEKAIQGKELKPVFTVEMNRTSVVLTPKRGTELEAAFDIGAIQSLGGKAAARTPVAEFELELLKGNPLDLIACARELTSDLALVLSLQSKSARGYALAEDTIDSPAGAGRVVILGGASAEDAFGQILSHCLRHLLDNWGAVVHARDPEGVHQMRVALRRLRSALTLFGGSFRLALRDLEAEVRWLAGVLGQARDLDVFQEDVFRPAAAAHGEDGSLDALATVVRTRRRIAWHGVHEALESERFRKLALDMAGVTFSRPWRGHSTDGEAAERAAIGFARERLDRCYRRAMKLGRRIGELDAGERHELRIRLKKFRYAVDFFSSLYPRRAIKRYLKRLSELQDVLGAMNDAAVARTLVRDILVAQGDGGSAASIAYAGGIVAGWHLGHMRARAKQLTRRWKRFMKLEPIWA